MVAEIPGHACAQALAGIDVSAVMRAFGCESAYFYFADVVRERCQQLAAALPANVECFYSIKANPNVHLTRLIEPRVAGAEISSAGELAIALAAGFRPERLLFVGPAKSTAEIELAIRTGVRWLVADSEDELREIAQVGERLQRRVDVLIRLNPSRRPRGAKLTMTGVSSQFGVDDEALEAVLASARSPWLKLRGFHVYLGTRFLQAKEIADNTRYILEFCFDLAQRFDFEPEVVDIGGGLGVAYFDGEAPLDLGELARELRTVIATTIPSSSRVRIVLETGRFLVAEAGVYATRVRRVKVSKGETWLLTHGGINHFYAGAFMGHGLRRNFPVRLLSGHGGEQLETVNVAGPLCTPGDLLALRVKLPRISAGDVLGVLCAGAYGYTVSPLLFLSHETPPELLVIDGTVTMVRPAQKPADVLAAQLALCGDEARGQP